MPDDLSSAWDAEALPQNDEHISHAAQPREEGVVPLGHNRGVFYYFSVAAGQVYELTPGQHIESQFMAMAEPQLWERGIYFVDGKGVNWKAAASGLMKLCRDVGIYSPERVRGRGAWLDGDRTVLHAGDRLIVDGHDIGSCQLSDSWHIYEQAQRLRISIAAQPLDNRSASRLMDLCMAPSWQDADSMGRLLAGWLVVAPICGAMPWRPHLWVTSEGGGGKSWIMDNIIRPIVSNIAVRFQGTTTEAAIRQTIGLDALPVLFDEFEAEDERGRERIQQVLHLARQASTEDSAAISKGGKDGRAVHYFIRCMMAFSSINMNLSRAADESRTVVLTLTPSIDPDVRQASFEKLKSLHADILTPEFPAALLARTLRLLPTIRHNAEVFAQAIARAGQTRRLGDTIGVLLAGAWSLRSTRTATAQEADSFITGTAWVQAAMSRSETTPEWQRALAFLVQQTLRITPSNNRAEDVPIGELLTIAAGRPADARAVQVDVAVQALARAGMRILHVGQEVRVCLANTSETLAEFFSRKTWGTAWLATLERAPRAEKHGTTAFGKLRSRAISLPIEHILGDEDAQ